MYTYVYMLAFDRQGTGPPLLLLHGTNSSRSIWNPLLPQLAAERETITVDLPAHGESEPTSFTPPEWAKELAGLLDDLDLDRVAVIGHSSGGWTALELAKLGRAHGVLALAPAGLWSTHSPPITDAILYINWHLGQLLGTNLATQPVRTKTGRRLLMRQISARPAEIPTDTAIAMTRTVLASKHFPEHFKQTRRQRFLNGQQIPGETPIHIIWGDKDQIARKRTSQHTDQLPDHATIETWTNCGHMLMWDAPQHLINAALALPA
jgi:pimeloyl-ACP methyl ester carboxylesterase